MKPPSFVTGDGGSNARITMNQFRNQYNDWETTARTSITCNTGDVLVYLDIPKDNRRCDGLSWQSSHLRVHKTNLSGPVFEAMLGKKEQQRVCSRLKKDIQALEQDGIKYIVDVSLANEGDNVAAQVAALSLPKSVRTWCETSQGLKNDSVNGHDDNCGCYRETAPGPGHFAEYCKVRHSANILRFLLKLEGLPIVLDSAPRVFTLAAIAQHFECPQALLLPATLNTMTNISIDQTSDVSAWFGSNMGFVEDNPEAAMRIAWNVELADITQISLRILAVENAIDETIKVTPTSQGRGHKTYTIFSRPRCWGQLTDDQQNIVERATNGVLDSVEQIHPLRLEGLKINEWNTFLGDGKSLGFNYNQKPVTIPASHEAGHRVGENRCRLAHFRLFLSLQDWFSNKIVCAFKGNTTLQQSSVGSASMRDIYSTKMNDRQRILSRYPYIWILKHNGYRDLRDYSMPDKAVSTESLGQLVDLYNANVSSYSSCSSLPLRGFSLNAFYDQLSAVFTAIAGIAGPYCPLALGIVGEREIAMLPEWAGGKNQGAGGSDEVPMSSPLGAPAGPGPSFYTGNTIHSQASSFRPSSATDEAQSTTTMTRGLSSFAIASEEGDSDDLYD